MKTTNASPLGLLLPILALCGCGGDGDGGALGVASEPVLGGERTGRCDWPAVVSLGGCSGVLVHSRLVVYAAHCGDGISEVRFGPSAATPTSIVATERCHKMPGARLGDGTDLAYCILQDEVTEIEPARILAGCERESLREGAAVTMVGFGGDGARGEYGVQRVGVSTIMEVGPDLLLDGQEVDTCTGDSGGPLFIAREEPDQSVSMRVVGITSAGSEDQCGSGTSHYVNLTEQVSWLEDSSGLDLTPCFAGDTWSPTPACVSQPRMDLGGSTGDEQACRLTTEPQPLASCGAPVVAAPDDEAPSVEFESPSKERIRRVLEADESYVEFEVSAAAEDEGSGVKEVRFSLLGEDGELRVERIDQVPEYRLPVLRVPAGRYTLVAEARDFAGNTAEDEIAIEVTSDQPKPLTGTGSCQIATPVGKPEPSAFWLRFGLVLAFIIRLSGRGA